MVVVCIANRDTDNTVKASKFNKDIYINLAKNEEYKEMKKCILVGQVPVIEGEPYNPVEYAVHVRKAKKFAEALNRYFAEKIWTTIACWTNQPAASMRYFLHNIRQCCLHRRLEQDSGSIKKKCRMRP